MPKVTLKYFTTVVSYTKKEKEVFDLPKGTTVEKLLRDLIDQYGHKFGQNVLIQVEMRGERHETANMFLNKKRIQWKQDFPNGLRTHLKDGDEIWLGLIAGGGAPSGLSERELERYHRQIIFEGWGEAAQEKLKSATVFIAGAGGLGSPLSTYLAVAGVGTLRICDFGEPELSNLNRQILHDDGRIGKNKAVSARETLERLNPDIAVEPVTEKILSENVGQVVGEADLMIDCLDNFETRHVLNRLAVEKSLPLLHGGVYGMGGQMMFIKPPETPCMWCINPGSPPPVVFPIVGATAGVIGCIQAIEALKYLSGVGDPLMGTLLIWDGTRMDFMHLPQQKDPNCPVCGEGG